MKFYPRLGIYKASNVTFNPTRFEAFSYNWWQFAKIVSGIKIFNNYRYSPNTGQQQTKVMRVMNYADDMVRIKVPRGLQKDNWIDDAKAFYEIEIEQFNAKLANKRIRTNTRQNLQNMVRHHELILQLLEQISKNDTAGIDVRELNKTLDHLSRAV